MPGIISNQTEQQSESCFSTLPPRGFSQVFILKGVKVICFDTLLQVFILKVDRAHLSKLGASRVKSTEDAELWDTPTPGVLQKESEADENKGNEREKERQES